jgi:HEAT repeat protein
VVLRRDAAWALAAAGGLIAICSLLGVILAWRAARRARAAVRLLEDIRRSARRPPPSVVAGPLGGQVPVMVPPETVFPAYGATPAEPAPPEVGPPLEDRPPGRIQRPPPDISRYEVRLPGPEPEARPVPSSEPPSGARAAPPSEPLPTTPPFAQEVPPPEVPAEEEERPPADETGALMQTLEDPDPFVRAKALSGLAGRPGVDPALIAALGDDYPMVRREAVRALRLAPSQQAAQALVDVVSHDPSAEVREEAVSVLAALLQRGASENS